MGDQEATETVLLYVYDLSQGFAAQMSQALLGKHIAGIWHTAVVVRGREYFYGGGVQVALAGSTPYGHPVEIVRLGETSVPQGIVEEYVDEMRQVFTPEAYNLFQNNCNNFSNELSTFLTGQGIPEHITALPAEVLSTPMGRMLAPMLSGMESRLGSVQQGDAPLELAAALPMPMVQPSIVASDPAVTPPAVSAGTVSSSRPSPPVPTESIETPLSKGSQGEKSAEAVQSSSQPAAKAAFEAAVRAEFTRLMAGGTLSANEAAAQAVAAAKQVLSQA